MKEIERFEKLKEMGYVYDPKTGDLIGKRGKVIKNKLNGYIYCSFKMIKHYGVYAHRYIWWLNYNEMPDEIDHINRVRSDNRLQNLRSVTHLINSKNTIGKGYEKRGDVFRASICVDRKKIYLGNYKTEQEAQQAYLEAKKKYNKI